MSRDVDLVRWLPLCALLLLWCVAFGFADAAVGQSPVEDPAFAISKELCSGQTGEESSTELGLTQDDPCCTDPCSEECEDFSAKCDANCPGIDTDCCTAPCTVDCQDPVAKCQNDCQDIDPDCCTNPCSGACGDLDAKCALCEDDTARCYAGCTSWPGAGGRESTERFRTGHAPGSPSRPEPGLGNGRLSVRLRR